MCRAVVREIALLDQFFDVVGNVRAEITTAERQFAHRHLCFADIEQRARREPGAIFPARLQQGRVPVGNVRRA